MHNIKMNATKVIEKMLKENTGTHFLDSGGNNGRMWQRNQNKVFKNEPRVVIDEYGETVSVFHYLNEILELDNVTRKVNSFITKKKLHWVDEVAEEIDFSDFMYHEIEKFHDTYNTYNGNSNLSQTLLFKTFKMYNDDIYVLLQIHGGADVRGGYTDTKCFKLKGYLTGQVDVFGSVNGKDFSNTYNGYSLTWKDTDEEVNLSEIDLNEVSADFYVCEETYMYE